MDIFEAYLSVRSRVSDLALQADSEERTRTVPACPEWGVHDLMAHVVGLPAALGSGRLPKGNLQDWLDSIVTERSEQSIEDLLREWHSLDESLTVLLNGSAGLLFDDLAVHEHDLRGALGNPDHSALDVQSVMPRALAAFSALLQAASLPPIAVLDRAQSWQSHEGSAGWTIQAPAWEALRAVSSRRTADELRAIPAMGDVEPYLAVLDAHLPLPTRSLGET